MNDNSLSKKFTELFYLILSLYFVVRIVCSTGNLLEPTIQIIYYDAVDLVFSCVGCLIFIIKDLYIINSVRFVFTKDNFLIALIGFGLYFWGVNVFFSKLTMTVLIHSTLYSVLTFSFLGVMVGLLIFCFFPISKIKIFKKKMSLRLFIIIINFLIHLSYSAILLSVLNEPKNAFLPGISIQMLQEYLYDPYLNALLITNIVFIVVMFVLVCYVFLGDTVRKRREKADKEISSRYIKNN